jgi:hypothetical protein
MLARNERHTVCCAAVLGQSAGCASVFIATSIFVARKTDWHVDRGTASARRWVPPAEKTAGLIEDFIGRYRKEYDFYDQAARLAAQILDANLQASGIRSMVTSRAKTVGRLEAKVRQRASGKQYASVEEIYKDVIDLAGGFHFIFQPNGLG